MKSSIDTLSKSTKSAFPYSRLSCSAMITSTETLRREDGSKSYSKCCQKHWRVSHLPQSSPLENGILLFQSQIRRHVHSWFIKVDFLYIYIGFPLKFYYYFNIYYKVTWGYPSCPNFSSLSSRKTSLSRYTEREPRLFSCTLCPVAGTERPPIGEQLPLLSPASGGAKVLVRMDFVR